MSIGEEPEETRLDEFDLTRATGVARLRDAVGSTTVQTTEQQSGPWLGTDGALVFEPCDGSLAVDERGSYREIAPPGTWSTVQVLIDRLLWMNGTQAQSLQLTGPPRGTHGPPSAAAHCSA
jgi:hypothetical protein